MRFEGWLLPVVLTLWRVFYRLDKSIDHFVKLDILATLRRCIRIFEHLPKAFAEMIVISVDTLVL
jgi:hypothetical protein